MSLTARFRSDGILNWNLAAIRIIGFSIKVRCPWLYKQNVLKVLLAARGNDEIRFHYLRGYDQRYNKILVFIIMNKRYTNIHGTKKTQTSSTTRCHNHYYNQTITIIIIIIIVIVTVLWHYSTLFAQVIVPQWRLNFECARTDIKQSRFIIIRKMTKNKKNANTKSKS